MQRPLGRLFAELCHIAEGWLCLPRCEEDSPLPVPSPQVRSRQNDQLLRHDSRQLPSALYGVTPSNLDH